MCKKKGGGGEFIQRIITIRMVKDLEILWELLVYMLSVLTLEFFFLKCRFLSTSFAKNIQFFLRKVTRLLETLVSSHVQKE